MILMAVSEGPGGVRARHSGAFIPSCPGGSGLGLAYAISEVAGAHPGGRSGPLLFEAPPLPLPLPSSGSSTPHHSSLSGVHPSPLVRGARPEAATFSTAPPVGPPRVRGLYLDFLPAWWGKEHCVLSALALAGSHSSSGVAQTRRGCDPTPGSLLR